MELRVYVDDPAYALVNDPRNIKLPLYIGLPLTVVGFVLLIIGILFFYFD